MTDKIIAYKGFDENMRCRGMQYAIGETFKHNGDVIACKKGLHSCENPLDVFGYYSPATSKYAVVEASGAMHRETNGDSKIASAELHIKAQIAITDLVAQGVKWILAHLNPELKQPNTGNRSASTNTGYRSASTNTGYSSASTNTGYSSASTNTGDHSASTNTGDSSASTNTGDSSASTNTGNRSASTNTGNRSASTNTGNRSASTNTGNRSASTNTGNGSASTNTGNRSASTNTGYSSASSVEGVGSVALAIGDESKAKASKGGAFCLVYRSLKDGSVLRLVTGVPGKNGVKADVWYTLNARGQLKVVKE